MAQLVEALHCKPEGRLQVQFLVVSLEFFIDHIMTLGSTQLSTEMSTSNISWEVMVAVA
jgi:hypothetical protein